MSFPVKRRIYEALPSGFTRAVNLVPFSWITGGSYRTVMAAALLFFCVGLLLFTPIKTPLSRYDEGAAVFAATRVMHGDVPHRDFWAVYPPGQSCALAVVFRLLGTTLLAARIYDTLVRLMIVMCVYALAKRVASSASALTACAATALVLGSAMAYGYAVFPALALGLACVLSSLGYVDTGQRWRLVMAGLLSGAAACFRWDIGLYAGISVALSVSLFRHCRTTQEGRGPAGAFLAAREVVTPLLGGALVILLPFYGYLVVARAGGALWRQVIVFPATVLLDVRRRSYPSLVPPIFATQAVLSTRQVYSELVNWLRFYLPPAVYSVVFLRYGHALLGRRPTLSERDCGTVTVAAFGSLLFLQALSRYDYVHVIPTLIIASLLIASSAWPSARSPRRFSRYALRPLLLVLLVPICLISPLKILGFLARNYPPWDCHSGLPRAGCVWVDRDQERTVEFIRAVTQPGEPIFVGNSRHDLIFVSDTGFYFLADRPSPTPYHQLHPGVTTTLPVQRRIAQDLVSEDVRWIVLVDMPDPTELNASTTSSGIDYLDSFIRSNYTPIQEFGMYAVLHRDG